MQIIEKKYVNWEKTGFKLQLLRNDNINLRRYVCYTMRYLRGECGDNCDECVYKMDRSISRAELAEVFNVSESVVYNWERGKTPIAIDDLLFYSQIAKVTIEEIVVFD